MKYSQSLITQLAFGVQSTERRTQNAKQDMHDRKRHDRHDKDIYDCLPSFMSLSCLSCRLRSCLSCFAFCALYSVLCTPNPRTQLTQLLDEVKYKLSPDDINNIADFIENNEFGLAYETLCTQLYEYDLKISYELYEKISFCGKSIKIHPSIWMPLKELIMDNRFIDHG